MENGSEKPKRGRPRTFDVRTEEVLHQFGILSPGETRRTFLNEIYRQGTSEFLWRHYEPAFRWLLDDAESCCSGSGRIRRGTIISELGRAGLDNGELALELAREICKLKPTMRRAIAMLRRFRIGRPARAT